MQVDPPILVPKHLVKKTAQVTTALCLVLGTAVSAQAATVVTFSDSGAATAIAGACSAIAWTAGSEFRLCDATGTALGAGSPYGKNVIYGGESWSFDNSGQMVGVAGMPTNPGAMDPAAPGSAAPVAGTNPMLQQPFSFFGSSFNFLAPTAGSLAGAAYGPGMYTVGAPYNGTFPTIFHFPVLELQWGGTWLPLGLASGGVTFSGTLSGCITTGLVTDCHFDIFANEYIDASEDPGLSGFAGWTAQWHLQGNNSLVYTAPAAVPVPAAVWLFGSGVLGLAGLTRRKENHLKPSKA